jgi:hypothetical protein
MRPTLMFRLADVGGRFILLDDGPHGWQLEGLPRSLVLVDTAE